MTGTLDDRIAAERRRAETYRTLAELFQPLADGRPAGLDGADGSDVSIAVERLRDAVPDRESLKLDHARLFVGPFDLLAPPYESVYVGDENRVMTEATERVQAAYREAGVDIDLDEPADHVAAELEFLFLLVTTEIEALEAGAFEAAAHYLKRQYEFLSDHLGRWVSEIAENMREHADTEFYRALADETRRFVEADGHLLADRLDRLETADDGLLAVLGGENA